MKTNYFTIPEIKVSYKDKVKTSDRMQVKCAKDLVQLFEVAFEDNMQHHEEVYAIFLNRANRVLGISSISKCGVSEAIVDVKIILQTALKVHCSAIILSHNHPSGNTKPSNADIAITNKLNDACKLMDITLLDHIIMTQEDHYSFANEGLI